MLPITWAGSRQRHRSWHGMSAHTDNYTHDSHACATCATSWSLGDLAAPSQSKKYVQQNQESLPRYVSETASLHDGQPNDLKPRRVTSTEPGPDSSSMISKSASRFKHLKSLHCKLVVSGCTFAMYIVSSSIAQIFLWPFDASCLYACTHKLHAPWASQGGRCNACAI